MALEVEEGGHKPRNVGGLLKQGNRFFPGASRTEYSLGVNCISAIESHVGLLTYKTVSKSVLFQVTTFGMNCYRNNRRLMRVFAFYAWHLSLNILLVLYNIPLHAYTTSCSSTIDGHLVVSSVGYCQLCCYEHSCACLLLTYLHISVARI